MNLKRTYARLLRLYPKDYRFRFEAEMLETFDLALEANVVRVFSVSHQANWSLAFGALQASGSQNSKRTPPRGAGTCRTCA